MALLPLLGTGHTPQSKEYGAAVRKGLDYLIAEMKPTDDGGSLMDRGNLYSHGLAATALAEAAAMTKDPNLTKAAQQTMDFIAFAQDPAGGGWRYMPRQPGDTSVFGWQMAALKAGQAAGLKLADGVLPRAESFLDGVAANQGANYGYTTPGEGPATTAIGLLSRQHLGWAKDRAALRQGAEWLGEKGPSPNNLYYNYYAAQVLRNLGGELWKKWNDALREQLIQSQEAQGHAAGSWFVAGGDVGAQSAGRLYCTAICVLTLETYYRYPPVYDELPRAAAPVPVPATVPVSAPVAAAVDVPAAAAAPLPAAQRPNLLYIMTDQQHAGMMSCAGNKWLKTPAMDSLAASGVRFERAYASNPVCIPSRVSMVTGRMPSYFGVRSNGDARREIAEKDRLQALGWLLRNAGYETAFGGKTHWLRGMTPASLGFDELTRDSRDELAARCAEFVQQKRDKPFLLVASLINPHDICYMAIDAHAKARGQPPLYPESKVERQCLARALELPSGVSRAEFFARLCPPLPANFEVPALEPECVAAKFCAERGFRGYVRKHWSDEDWRLHRWAYCRLTESVDAQIGRILAALRAAGIERQTVVIFSSDHGDHDAAHRLEHKSVLYEEACRVPFVVSWPGVTKAGQVDERYLVSAGVDLLPTLCDYAGVRPPAGLPGRSVRPLAEGRDVADWRDRVVVETQFGRMLRTARFKYNLYDSGQRREQLIDLAADPGEMNNLAGKPGHFETLLAHRRRLRQSVEQLGDEIAREWLVADDGGPPQ